MMVLREFIGTIYHEMEIHKSGAFERESIERTTGHTSRQNRVDNKTGDRQENCRSQLNVGQSDGEAADWLIS
jgi:hypothetical protein